MSTKASVIHGLDRRDIRNRIRHPTQLQLVKEIGHGAFGRVLLMRDPDDNNTYAVKTEPLDAEVQQLPYEFRVYRELLGCPGIPLAFSLWVDEANSRHCLAMQVLGPSLDKCLSKITQWDVINWVAPKALSIIEHLHTRGFLHRDIKPENFLTGHGGLRSHEIYLVDFGLSKKYRTPGSHAHIPYRDGKSLTGTVRYASVHTHQGIEQSRRDDLESLGYVMLFLINKSLPWMGMQAADRGEQNNKVMQSKRDISLDKLCRGVPPAFVHYFRYVRRLKFDCIPDYNLLRGYFRAT